jgi:hypothetical protein
MGLSDKSDSDISVATFSVVRWGAVALGVLFALALAYGELTGAPDITTPYGKTEPVHGKSATGSYLVATMADMIDTESRNWAPGMSVNPRRLRVDLPNYQLGLEDVFSRVVTHIRDDAALQGIDSSIDSDLNSAVKKIQYGADHWMPFLSTASSYRKAANALRAYNARLADGQAGFYPRINTLSNFVGELIRVTGGAASRLDKMDEDGNVVGFGVRAQYAYGMGVLKATCDVLQALGHDFKEVIDRQSANGPFDLAQERTCAALEDGIPFIVLNGGGKGLVPNHVGSLAGKLAKTAGNLQNLQAALAGASNATVPNYASPDAGRQ